MDTTDHDIPILDRKGLREFAFLTGGIVAVLFGLVVPWIFDSRLPLWPWVVLGILILWGFFVPATLGPIYRTWMRFGILMSRVTTPLIMGLIFYLVITPVGIARRLFGSDPMQRKMTEAESYRVASKKADVNSLKRPF